MISGHDNPIMPTNEPPNVIKFWLNDRGITDEIIREAKIGWKDNKIVIPVFDKDGKHLFNKYRRSPQVHEGPKYTYEHGASTSLYGVETLYGSEALDKNPLVYICEGELDSLVLRSFGYNAVSTTGGCSSFKEEWVELLNGRSVSICYDYDEAGIKGAIKVHKMIPRSTLVWLPREGQDITSYFQTNKTLVDFVKLPRRQYSFQVEDFYTDEGAATRHRINMLKKHSTGLPAERKVLQRTHKPQTHINILEDEYEKEIRELKSRLTQKESRTPNPDNPTLMQAKETPIDVYVNFKQNKARCLWHDEKTPSMHYYAQTNRVKCFGCEKSGDVIDVVRQLYNLSLPEAIEKILHG